MEKRDIILICFLILALLALAATFYDFSDYDDNTVDEVIYSYGSEDIQAGETAMLRPTKIGTINVKSGEVKTVPINRKESSSNTKKK